MQDVRHFFCLQHFVYTNIIINEENILENACKSTKTKIEEENEEEDQMKKKSLCSLLVGCVLLSALAGCSNAKEPETKSTTAAETTVAANKEVESPVKQESAAETSATLDFPTKPVEATVQWAAGGGGDLVFRALADVFSDHANGQPMVIKNVEGASGVTGSTEFLDAKADGYQVMHVNTAHVSKIHMSEVPYDIESFDPVIQIVESANYLLVNADAEWETLQDFIDDALANPGSVSIANSGVGGGNHLAALLFEQAVEAEFSHIAYSGGSAAITGVLSGEVDAFMGNAPEGMTNVDAGQLKILATFGSVALEDYPDVPTALDLGLDLTIEQWRGVVVPKGTPEDVVQKLHDIIKECIEDEKYIEAIKSLGAVPAYKNTADFKAFMESENKRFEELIKAKGLGDRYSSGN